MDCPAKWVNLRLFEDPRLGARDDALRCPAREGTTLEKEACSAECAPFCGLARDDIAGDNVGGVWVWVSQEKCQRDDWPWVIVSKGLGEEFHGMILSYWIFDGGYNDEKRELYALRL
jgi:hypothetical protein